VRAVGKGVRRTSSKFGARLEPGSHVDIQLHTRRSEGQDSPGAHRGLDLVTQAESLGAYGAAIASDYAAWTVASAMYETTERLTEPDEPVLRLYLLLVGALKSLAGAEHHPGLILDAFLIRAMARSGWEPALRECATCAAPGPHGAFHVAGGGVVCEACRPPGSVRPAPETIRLMTALLDADWPAAEAAESVGRREASGLIAAHLQWHLERGLRSLAYVDRAGTPCDSVAL
jgi:DNA repair protein RecO (recombination protein O)